MMALSSPPLRQPLTCSAFVSGLVSVLALTACGPVSPPPQLAADPILPSVRQAMIIDPPVLPGTPVALVPDAERRPVVYYPQPARISPPGEPLVLPPPIPHGDRQTTLVEAVPVSLGTFPRHADGHRLVALLDRVGGGRFDALHLEIRGSDHGIVRTIVRAAMRAGVDPAKIRLTPSDGPAEVIATRYAAATPVCPSLAIIGPSVIDNDFEPTLGCSTRRNLAATVNDPADLLGNGAVLPADGARGSVAIQAYRSGASPQRAGSSGGGGTSDGGSESGGYVVPGAAPVSPVLGPGTSSVR